ncbi:MAG: nucleoside-diphosphate kinase [Patescibacteria group bacterium]
MDKDLQRTLVLLKPDAVQRCLVGRILQRFEDVGLKIVGMKMVWVDERLANEHYNDLGVRRGEDVKKKVVDMLTKLGPVVAVALEGIDAVEEVRMMVGSTEPKAAQPGTIRGDFAHISYDYANKKGIGIKNVIHASGTIEEANREVMLWFNFDELYDYKTVNDIHILQ